jgi:hypothetical protein
VISPKQRPLPDNTQHSQETDINAATGIQTLSSSQRAATDPRLRARDCRDRQSVVDTEMNFLPIQRLDFIICTHCMWPERQRIRFVGESRKFLFVATLISAL